MRLTEANRLMVAFADMHQSERKLRHLEIVDALTTIAEHNPDRGAGMLAWVRQSIARPDWVLAARPGQLTPGTPGAAVDRADWDYHLILAGRGWGKNRSGAEDFAERLKQPDTIGALVAAKFSNGRDDMVEGESSLLRCIAPSLLINGSVSDSWNRSHGLLRLANGTRAQVYSAEKPGQLRGPQHHYAWVDELAKFKDANVPTTEDSTWSNLVMTMRLGKHPQVVITTTPRPCLVLTGTRDRPQDGLLHNPNTVITTGSTFDNIDNLAGTFRRQLEAYDGTRLGRQELYAEILTDIEGALWTSHLIESGRVAPGYEQGVGGGLVRVVVAIDPSVGMGHEHNDECGIVVAGKSADGHGYIMEDLSAHMAPDKWARRAVKAYHEHEADVIVAEKNNGGQLVAEMIRVVDNTVPVKLVSATRAKYTRAEPVAALYEQGLIHHIGIFPKLEDQMTSVVAADQGDGTADDRFDAMVYGLNFLYDIGGREQPMTHSRRGPSPGRR